MKAEFRPVDRNFRYLNKPSLGPCYHRGIRLADNDMRIRAAKAKTDIYRLNKSGSIAVLCIAIYWFLL